MSTSCYMTEPMTQHMTQLIARYYIHVRWVILIKLLDPSIRSLARYCIHSLFNFCFRPWMIVMEENGDFFFCENEESLENDIGC